MKYKFLILSIACLLTIGNEAKAQFIFGNTGLLHLPTADMQADKTAMFGASSLNMNATPERWYYDTYNYYINITILPFLEISYCMCLFSGDDMRRKEASPGQHFDKWANQDRDFSFRLRAVKEGQFFDWMPSVVLGANDCLHTLSGDRKTGYVGFWSEGNGFWGKGYLALTKHFTTGNFGRLGVHAAYMYNEREDFSFKGPGAGLDYRTTLASDTFVAKAINGLDLRAEWDSRNLNVGFGYKLWNDHINFVAEWYDCKYFSCGIALKTVLK